MSNEDAIYESSAHHPDLEEELELQPYVEIGLWRMRGGKLIKISEMTDDHLNNAIRWLDRQGLIGSEKHTELLGERSGRGPKP